MTHNQGIWPERVARFWLRLKGYNIIAKNYKTGRGTHAGEIDFIATKKNLIVFVEVKKRSSLEKAAYAIRPQQQQRIIRGAEAFLQKNPFYKNHEMRFDAVLVIPFLRIQHIKDAWRLS